MINVWMLVREADLNEMASDTAHSIGMTRLVFNNAKHPHYPFETICRVKTQGATTTHLISFYPPSIEDFKEELPPNNANSKSSGVIGAWNYDGSQYGMRRDYDEDGVFLGFVKDIAILDNANDFAFWTFQRTTYIDDYAPVIILPDETTKPLSQALTDGDINEIPQLNLKARVQKPRDLIVHS